MAPRIPQHSSKTNEHYTPVDIIERARTTMGWIDLDPASCAEANAWVQAGGYFKIDDDGLARTWFGNVFLNPPGGHLENKAEISRWQTKSRACAWWRKLCEEYALRLEGFDGPYVRNITQAVFIGFTLEIIRSAQSGAPFPIDWLNPLDFAFCVPKSRLCFGGKQPTHANIIVYMGPYPNRFEQNFRDVGKVRL